MSGFFDDLKEIITLSKESGMALSEVVSLMKMASSEDNEPQPEKNTEAEKTEEQDTGKEQPEGAQENATQDQEKKVDDVIDYKKKVEELENKLQDLQKENVNKDLSDKNKLNDDDVLNDITRSFM